MAFEDKMNKLQSSMNTQIGENASQAPRLSKSYTLKQDVANELASRAKEQELTASRYLEKLLKKEFDM